VTNNGKQTASSMIAAPVVLQRGDFGRVSRRDIARPRLGLRGFDGWSANVITISLAGALAVAERCKAFPTAMKR